MGRAAIKRNAKRSLLLVLPLLLCNAPLGAQDTTAQRPSAAGRRSDQIMQSGLAKENEQRVAASAAQIKEILLLDAGLLVELKRHVAKEATDSGQIIDDSNLSDFGIFERLERDVPFRSFATKLLQNYGYLLPSVNPNSDYGKQQEFVLKERARRLVQIEAQEDATATAESQRILARSEIENCDEGEQGCGKSTAQKNKRTTGNTPTPAQSPLPAFPQLTTPLPQLSSPQILRTGNSSSPEGESAGSQQISAALKQLSQAQDASSVFGGESEGGEPSSGSSGRNRAMQLMQGMAQSQGGIGVGPLPMSLEASPADELPSLAGASTTSGSAERRGAMRSASNGILRPASGSNAELTPVAMVHKSNPYADVPALYDLYVQASARRRSFERFGLDIFSNEANDSESIPMDLPVGPEYVVGPGDSLAIDVWGGVSQRILRTVDREGRISLPEAGPVLVSGSTLGDVQRNVQRLLRTQFRDISADVSLAKLRTVRVYVVGDVPQPGAYDISSLSTPLNALFAAGGVTQGGSLRSLQHYRGATLVEEVDAYDLLLHGVRGDLKRLENGDTLRVPPVGPQITIDGMVRRPGTYELREEKSLDDALELAGGILPAAALKHIEVQRLESHTRRTMLQLDLSASSNDADGVAAQLAAFKVQDGDQIHIFPIAPYNENAIYLQGHVLRPGRYSFHEGMKLNDLIASYADLLPEPAGNYAEIVRINAPDSHPSVESFSLADALANPATAPELKPLDTVRIFSRFDFESSPSVWINGEVRAPGKYLPSGQVHVRDAVYLAGGPTDDAATDNAQLFRTEPNGLLKVKNINLKAALSGDPAENILLQPRDRLLLHRTITSLDPPSVWIEGEVAKPGRYPLAGNMHLNDLVQIAGGLKRSADSATADLASTAPGANSERPGESIRVALSEAMAGNTNENKTLKDGDVLTIRQNPGWNDVGAIASVRGEVQHPGAYGVRPGERLSELLLRAGGFGPEAFPYGAVLMRREVRELEMRGRSDLIQRVKAQSVYLKALPEIDPDQKNAKLTAVAQTESVLHQLQATEPVGRVVIHIRPKIEEWKNTADDVPVREGDVLVIPKKAAYVSVSGQVFNPTAVSFRPGRSARWYLAQAGGMTQLADKKAAFVVRADGSVISAKNNSGGWFSGDPLSAALRPGDSIVVPERAPNVGARNLTPLLSAAQIAASIALTASYLVK